MSKLKNLNSENLVDVISAQRDKYRGEMWKILGATVTNVNNCEYYDSGVPQSNANGVICNQIDNNNVEKIVDSAIEFFDNKQLPFCWLTGSVESHREFYTFMQSKGFKLKIEPGMALDLEKSLPPNTPTQKLSIIKGLTEDQIEIACEASLKSWGFPRDFSEPHWRKSVETKNQTFFIAVYNNTPVGISEVFYWGGVAGIYFVGVSEEARGQGIGTAVTLAAVNEAKERGYKWAILHSSQMGFNMYKHIGFEQICELGECHWNQNV